MKHIRLFVLVCLASAITLANSAQAQIPGPSYKDTPDGGCASVYTGTAGCFGADGTAANGGVAGGMSACTAWKFCVTCAQPVSGGQSICVEAKRNAWCSCSDASSGRSVCASSGSCTYKGAKDDV